MVGLSHFILNSVSTFDMGEGSRTSLETLRDNPYSFLQKQLTNSRFQHIFRIFSVFQPRLPRKARAAGVSATVRWPRPPPDPGAHHAGRTGGRTSGHVRNQ